MIPGRWRGLGLDAVGRDARFATNEGRLRHYEALIAACFIFIVHFFNVHLRPDKFPLDAVMFHGRASVAYMDDRVGLVEQDRFDRGETEEIAPGAVAGLIQFTSIGEQFAAAFAALSTPLISDTASKKPHSGKKRGGAVG